MTLVGQKITLFRENLMKNPNPKSLKDPRNVKGIKRGKNASGACSNEGNEPYDCDGDEISYPINIEDQFGPPSDNENEQTTERTNADEPFVDATSTDTLPERKQNERIVFQTLVRRCFVKICF